MGTPLITPALPFSGPYVLPFYYSPADLIKENPKKLKNPAMIRPIQEIHPGTDQLPKTTGKWFISRTKCSKATRAKTVAEIKK